MSDYLAHNHDEYNDDLEADATSSTPDDIGGKSDLLTAALAWARAGFKVFPCLPGAKQPAVKNGFLRATDDPEQITAWWTTNPDYNIGVVPESGGCAVIDLDGAVGIENWQALATEYGALATYTVLTPSGGRHLWYRGSLPPTTSKLAAKIDTRGRGSYALVPPSVVNGRAYAPLDGSFPPDPSWETKELPEWVAEKLATKDRPKLRATEGIELDSEWNIQKGRFRCREVKNVKGLPAEGQRNNVTFNLACDLKDYGLSKAKIVEVLQEEWNCHLDLPLDDDELETIARSAHDNTKNEAGCRADPDPAVWSEYVENPPEQDEEPTQEPGEGVEQEKTEPPIVSHSAPLDTAAAFMEDRFTTAEGKRTLIRYRGDWYAWTGTHYRRVSNEALKAKLYPFLHSARVNTKGDDGEWSTKPFAPDQTKVNKVLDALPTLALLEDHIEAPTWLDRMVGKGEANRVIACQNGLLLVNDADRVLIGHDAGFFGLNALPFDYDPRAPKPVEWLKFLDSLWGDDPVSITTLQEWLGYLVSSKTDLQKILLLVGPSRSGKGTILKIIRRLLGAENVCGPTLASLKGEFGLEPWIGKAVALISDARVTFGPGNATVTERLLTISGGDHLSIPRKHKTAWEGVLPTRPVIASNEALGLDDASSVIVKRFVALRMLQSFYGKEDLELEARLVLELPGILNWALEGLARLIERGHFLQPESGVTILETMEASASPVRTFVTEQCVICKEEFVVKERLYDAWRFWCGQNGYTAGNIADFTKKLTAAFPEVSPHYRPQVGTGRPRCYGGIGLCPAATDAGAEPVEW